ncbi:HlyD family secretion protein [Sphingobacterium griseoflavum]|uniref:Hemolysin n=1 Tax=Sphingobacterium griseoflavum TaxID=1474952 RepID=A0ABQ3HVJ9_9SPHI|nr:HlyD family efflux transporter periplasmic adaptor subunit [Sphingobacterium griseoflavum]GHE31783.1 hemolysin [Sphingobacterium griseoflavum]
MAKKYNLSEEDLHSEDLQEIISKPPSWLLERGISFVLLTIFLLLGLSFFIRYPELVMTELKFNTANAPKVVVSRVSGSITKLLANDGTWVEAQTPIAYLESTADHEQLLNLLATLQQFRTETDHVYDLENIIPPNQLQLGELQGSYESFYLAYLNYRSAGEDGIYHQRKGILHNEMNNIRQQYDRAEESFKLQRAQLDLAEQEYDRYRILAEKKVISPLELQQKEALLLAKRQSIPQLEGNMIAYESNLLSKKKELSDLDNQIVDEKKKFVQSLNSFISDAKIWEKKYVLLSPARGKLIYGSFLQENQLVQVDQELFYVNPNSDRYYGEMLLPQQAIAKVKQGQEVLVKVRSYPYKEYGFLRGKVDYISDIPIKDSLFFARARLIREAKDSLIKLKPGIYADAEIITDDQSIFKRIWSNLSKSMKF